MAGRGSSTASPGGPDAPSDGVPDTRPPMLLSTTPTSDTWLEEPVRLVFDEAIDPASLDLAVTAQLAGTAGDDAGRGRLGSEGRHDHASIPRSAGSARSTFTSRATSPMPPATQPRCAPTFISRRRRGARPAVDLGAASSSPATVIDSRGAVLAAWTVGDPGSRHVVVGQLYGGAWQPLGAAARHRRRELAGDRARCAAAAADRWRGSRSGTAHVARWDSGAWVELPSPGTGSASRSRRAGRRSGRRGVRRHRRGVRARQRYVAAGRQRRSTSGTLVGEPALAVGSAGASRGRLDRRRTRCTSIASTRAGRRSRRSRCPRRRRHRSHEPRDARHRARRRLRRVGRLVRRARGEGHRYRDDVDAPRSPARSRRAERCDRAAVAIDPERCAGRRVDRMSSTDARARSDRAWTGSTWPIVGGTPWLPIPTPRRRARRSRCTPVARRSSAGRAAAQLDIARFNGPATPRSGITTRASIAGCAFDPANPPRCCRDRLLHDVATPGQPCRIPGLVPYDIVVELWTDGA